MRSAILAILATLAFVTLACQSHHEEGVTSSYHSQWTEVAADTKTTTDAAKAVLASQGLKDVKASSTGVDGGTKSPANASPSAVVATRSRPARLAA